MWKIITKIHPIALLAASNQRLSFHNKALKYTVKATALTYSLCFLQKVHPISPNQPHEASDKDKKSFKQPQKINKFVSFLKYLSRFLQLCFIFAPSVLTLPLILFKATRDFWLDIFLNAVQRSGIVWIKAFQYLSHRRDIIGDEMAEKFEILRQHSPLHSRKQTQKIIRRVYGKQINQMFVDFEQVPIGSGSVSQVYRAKFHGKDVAVKVRHPEVDNNLQRDIDLLFLFSRALSKLSKIFEVPITVDSLKQILREQVYFLRQKQNLDNFGSLTVDKNVSFPVTYPQSTDEVLIEEYINGKTIAFYESNTHNLNKVIANIGAKAFFSMLMKYNFVHADCHAGNILVRFKDVPNTITTYLANYFQMAKHYLISKFVKFALNNQFLRKLSEENYLYQLQIQSLIDLYKQKAEIILIDVGMAIRLTKQKKQSFQSFLKEIIQGDPLECAKWIYRISTFNDSPLTEGQNKPYLDDLETMFKRVHETTLENLQGIVVLKQMLGVIREHNMKIDGEISILLTNMLILESIAKDLDPNINILRCAVPYLHYR